MALSVCRYCINAVVVVGPRNLTKRDRCCPRCRWKGLREMAELDMLSREEADELNNVITEARDGR